MQESQCRKDNAGIVMQRNECSNCNARNIKQEFFTQQSQQNCNDVGLNVFEDYLIVIFFFVVDK